jgi:hypothetical protein
MEQPKKFDKPRKGKADSEPKYQDTDESKAQLEKIRVIEAQMKEVQLKLVSARKPKTCCDGVSSKGLVNQVFSFFVWVFFFFFSTVHWKKLLLCWFI